MHVYISDVLCIRCWIAKLELLRVKLKVVVYQNWLFYLEWGEGSLAIVIDVFTMALMSFQTV